MTRSKLFLAISMLARIGTGLVSLFVLARGLGPADYGFLATVFAYASIAALLTDFGFPVQALRDIGAQPERAGELIAACIRVKNLLVTAASLVAIIALPMIGIAPDLFWASVLLFGSIILLSYGDLALVALRGIGRYDTETYAVIVGTACFVVIVGTTVLLFPAILPIAFALLIARLIQTLVSFWAFRRYVRLESCLFGPLLDSVGFAKSSSGLALDSVLTTLSAQLDTIFVSVILGLEAAGVYQVAARLTNYVLLPIQVLAGVYMPALALQHRNATDAFHAISNRMNLEFAGIGLVLGCFVALVVPLISEVLFGNAFQLEASVWFAFGALVFLRYVVSSLGVALTARRGVRYRIIGQAAAVLTICTAMGPAIASFGMLAAPVVMAVATLITIVIYWVGGVLLAQQHRCWPRGTAESQGHE